MEQSRNIEMWHCLHLILFLAFNDFKQVHFCWAFAEDPRGCLAVISFTGICVMSSSVPCVASRAPTPSRWCCASSRWLRRHWRRCRRLCVGRSLWTRCSLCAETGAFISANRRATGPVRGGRTTAASWTNAAFRAANCGGWRCTARLWSPAKLHDLYGRKGTQTPQGHQRNLHLDIVTLPVRRFIRRTRAEETQEAETIACRRQWRECSEKQFMDSRKTGEDKRVWPYLVVQGHASL